MKSIQEDLVRENEELRRQLAEAEEALSAIREGQVDAIVVEGSVGPQVFSLTGAETVYRLAVETMAEAAINLALDGTILFCNAQFGRFVGQPVEEIIGHNLCEFVATGDRDTLREMIHRCAHEPVCDRVVFCGPDSEATPTRVTGTSLQLQETSLCFVASDLTELEKSAYQIEQLHRTQAELRESRQTAVRMMEEAMAARKEAEQAKGVAESASRAKDDFMAILSHELRTPLNPALLATSMLEMAPELSPDLKEDIAVVRRNLELEARLIDDLLDLTKISRGKLSLNCRTVNGCDVLRQAVEICRPEIQQSGVELELEGLEQEISIHADPARLQQVFWNLLKNAVKFTPAAGRIAVVATSMGEGGFRVEVSDTGRGIEPELLTHIFREFDQGTASVNRRYGGLGLGLAICKRVVEMHKGAIFAFSEGPGKGATFTVELPPVSPRCGGSDDVVASNKASPVKLCQILLVEDHQVSAKFTARLLESFGHKVRIASSLKEAVSCFDQVNPDILVSDIGLPDGSGLDLLKLLSDKRPVKAIALSGYGMEIDVKRSRQAGFLEHLIKPVEAQQLEEAIARLVGPCRD